MPTGRHEIIHVSPALFGDEGIWGGGERYALELARAQAQKRPTRLITFGRNARRITDGPLAIHVLRPRGYYRGDFLNPISETLVPELARAKVVHLHQIYTALSDWAALWCKLLGRIVVATDLGGSPPNLETRFCREAVIQRHLALSQFAARYNPQWQGRTAVIGGGVDRRFLAPHTAPRVAKVVYVGRLMPYKGADVLIRAMPADLPLHLYGRPYDRRYFALLQQLALHKRVVFHLSASDDDVLTALRTARVAVLPSVPVTAFGNVVPKMELFGLALVEAMACGTPVICSEAGAMPEVVKHDETGLVVPPSDVNALRAAIERLIRDDEGWARMSAAARRDVLTSFTWERVAERCFSVYDDPTLVPARRAFSVAELRKLFRPPRQLTSWVQKTAHYR